jgi:hypothetical protein
MFPDLQGFDIVETEALSFVHFPIRDCGITDDERVLELARNLVKAISEKEVRISVRVGVSVRVRVEVRKISNCIKNKNRP